MLLLCVSLSAGAEQYYFKHFDTGDGLPSNTVLCMTEDSYGFMWFGTKDGACRYDGKRCAAGGVSRFRGCVWCSRKLFRTFEDVTRTPGGLF